MIEKEQIVIDLLKWFKQNKRWMPWRETKNPYYIWISEIMLQQTRVETVIDYYTRFIERFPTIEDLAAATEEDVLKSWEGLGYYSRGRNLHKAAKVILEKHQGIVPSTYKEIIKIPGIGPYTAGAVLSIAYNQPVPAIDGNVMRVYSRLYNISKDIMAKETVEEVRQRVEVMMPDGYCGDFSEALMELGATICTPKNYKCEACPIRDYCRAKEQNLQEQLPVRIIKTKVTQHNKAVLWIEDKIHNQILVKKNKDSGLLAGMWVLPTLDLEKKSKAVEDVQQVIDEKTDSLKGVTIEEYVGESKHVFTHQKWQISIFRGVCTNHEDLRDTEFQWVSKGQLKDLAFPTVYIKIISVS
ncbi:A/G-specific adenine glycosylase [Alkaliphilus hydrothermalis]|uniref:Adenine DNA glycosylase n=1 Tax=Alkaliphilus hydrothermalis TaxID=1482730 RepID=A0ABS2NRS3_9FIRM|nr:A/G-specific adenine glycosylase [Alkaliphilus hydrothermalis]MBM7615648.1 A/G-specific adenine glycosylase [Alkaliphilus hydrothermalis]